MSRRAHSHSRIDSRPNEQRLDSAMPARLSSSKKSATSPRLEDCSIASTRLSVSNADAGIAAPDHEKDYGEEVGESGQVQGDSQAREGRPSASLSPRSRHEELDRKQLSETTKQAHASALATARPSNVRNATHSTSATGYSKDDATSPKKRQNARQSQSAHQSKPAPPFSLAGAARQEQDTLDLEAGRRRVPSNTDAESASAQRRRDRGSRVSRSAAQAPPPGVAVPMPQPRKRPTWATRGATKQPLYSLGKPLPTHEEVQAQKEWEEQMNRIKEQYPNAQPPQPPPLPSQTANTSAAAGAMGMGGMQIDRDQLQDVIRTVIAEFYGFQVGEVPLEPLQGGNRALAAGAGRRTSFHDPGSTSSGRRRAIVEGSQVPSALQAPKLRNVDETEIQGGSDLETLDSMVVDDEDDDPLPEGRVSRSRHRAPVLWSRKNGRPRRELEQWRPGPEQAQGDGTAEPSDGPKEGARCQPAASGGHSLEQHREELARRDQEPSDHLQPALPSVPERRDSGNSSPDANDGEVTAVHSRADSPAGASPTKKTGSRRTLSVEDDASLVLDADEDIPESQGDYDPDYKGKGDDFPNPIARYRSYVREEAAEFLGAFVLSVIGTGATAQTSLSMNEAISPSGQGSLSLANNLTAPLAWGIGVAVSVYIAGGISGGHISPTITIVLALFRGFPWRKVPGYMAAQILGFIAGSATAYGLYRHAISLVEGGGDVRTLGTAGTASYLATYPSEDDLDSPFHFRSEAIISRTDLRAFRHRSSATDAYVSNANAFFNEFTDTTILLVLVLAIGDVNGVPPPAGLNPLVLMFTITAIMLSLGVQTSACLNPSRDLGPRLVSWWVGYGTGVWEDRSHVSGRLKRWLFTACERMAADGKDILSRCAQYWLWLWPADILGGAFGAILYDVLIFTGEESPINWRWSWRAWRLAALKHRYLAWRRRQKVKNETRKASYKETGQAMQKKGRALQEKRAERKEEAG